MKGLYKNEMQKLIAQTSFKVILILALVLSLLIPLGMIGADALFSVNFYDGETSYYEEWLEEETDPVQRAWIKTQIDMEKWFQEQGISTGDWRYQKYVGEYETVLHFLYGYRLVAEKGFSFGAVRDRFYYLEDGYESIYSAEKFVIPGRYVIEEDGFENEDIWGDSVWTEEWTEDENWTPPTASEAAGYCKLMEKEKQALEEKILHVTIGEYYGDCRNDTKLEIEAKEAMLTLLRSNLSASANQIEKEQIQYAISKNEL